MKGFSFEGWCFIVVIETKNHYAQSCPSHCLISLSFSHSRLSFCPLVDIKRHETALQSAVTLDYVRPSWLWHWYFYSCHSQCPWAFSLLIYLEYLKLDNRPLYSLWLPCRGNTLCLTIRSSCCEFWCGARCDPFSPNPGQLAPNWVRAEHWTGTTHTDYTCTELSMNVACNMLFIVCKTGQLYPGHGCYHIL